MIDKIKELFKEFPEMFKGEQEMVFVIGHLEHLLKQHTVSPESVGVLLRENGWTPKFIGNLNQTFARVFIDDLCKAIADKLLRPEKVHAVEIEEAYNEQIVEDKPDFQEMADYINRKE